MSYMYLYIGQTIRLAAILKIQKDLELVRKPPSNVSEKF